MLSHTINMPSVHIVSTKEQHYTYLALITKREGEIDGERWKENETHKVIG